MPPKEDILKACNAVPINNLINVINSGVVSYEELQRAGLREDKQDYIKRHLQEEEETLWNSATEQNTIESYNNYVSQTKLKQHLHEAQNAIISIEDDNAWNKACIAASPGAYLDYIYKYPQGRHLQEANSRIYSGAEREQVLDSLKRDLNAYKTDDIKRKVDNGVISWDDIRQIMGSERTLAIQQFQSPTQLPNAIAPQRLEDNTTEVYFWGTPGSGKTCALGTILSSAKRSGILEPLQCNGLYYMNLLSNIFVNDTFCILPDSTTVTSIQEMVMELTDAKGHQHKLTLIDLAGELFKTVFEMENKLEVKQDGRKLALEKAMSYLKDRRNNKIHFFVIEYGGHSRKHQWHGQCMSDYLTYMIQFLKRENVFSKSTVGVYVLVTKCDKIPCAKDERPRRASDYVDKEFASFWNAIKRACEDAGIRDLKKLSFSIGDVFAQELCKFDSTDTNKVIDKLLTKTPAIKKGIIDWLRK